MKTPRVAGRGTTFGSPAVSLDHPGSDPLPFEEDIDFLISRNLQKPTTPPAYDIAQWAESRRVLPGSSAASRAVQDRLDRVLARAPGMLFAILTRDRRRADEVGAVRRLDHGRECHLLLHGKPDGDPLRLGVPRASARMEHAAPGGGDRFLRPSAPHRPAVGEHEDQQTGDRLMSKAFRGGSLMLASAQAAASLRSSSRRVAVFDECDAAPANLVRTREGNYLDVAIARTAAYGHRAKRLYISTPGEYETSLILKKHDQGDARRFMVNCVFCEHEQELRFGDENTPFGLKAEYGENGVLVAVRYKCESPACGKLMENYHKAQLLASGRWVPTRASEQPPTSGATRSAACTPCWSPGRRSISCTCDSATDQESLRSFYNLSLGLPFQPQGSRPELKTVLEARGAWHAGTIPSTEILFVTGAADVMRGKEKDPEHRAY